MLKGKEALDQTMSSLFDIKTSYNFTRKIKKKYIPTLKKNPNPNHSG